VGNPLPDTEHDQADLTDVQQAIRPLETPQGESATGRLRSCAKPPPVPPLPRPRGKKKISHRARPAISARQAAKYASMSRMRLQGVTPPDDGKTI